MDDDAHSPKALKPVTKALNDKVACLGEKPYSPPKHSNLAKALKLATKAFNRISKALRLVTKAFNRVTKSLDEIPIALLEATNRIRFCARLDSQPEIF